jgi:hypothetical protein
MFPTDADDETAVPFMNQIAVSPRLSFHRGSLIPSLFKSAPEYDRAPAKLAKGSVAALEILRALANWHDEVPEAAWPELCRRPFPLFDQLVKMDGLSCSRRPQGCDSPGYNMSWGSDKNW